MKQDREKPQGMLEAFILQHIEALCNIMESAACFLYGVTCDPNALPNIIPKALTAHLSSAPGFPPGM